MPRGIRYPRFISVRVSESIYERLCRISDRHNIALAVITRDCIEKGVDQTIKSWSKKEIPADTSDSRSDNS